MNHRSIPVSETADPWVDFWYARLYNTHNRVLGYWRVPCVPPYQLRYRADVRVVLDRIEFLDHDLGVRATWDLCRGTELLGGSFYALDIESYGTNGKTFKR